MSLLYSELLLSAVEMLTEEQQVSLMLAQEASRAEDWTQSDPLKASQGWRLSTQ